MGITSPCIFLSHAMLSRGDGKLSFAQEEEAIWPWHDDTATTDYSTIVRMFSQVTPMYTLIRKYYSLNRLTGDAYTD